MSATPPIQGPKWVRPVVDFGGLAMFGLVYFATHDLLKATWAVVAASALAIIVGLAVEKRLAPFPLIVGVFGLVFGGLTLATGDTAYLKMEGSFLYVGLGVGLLLGVWRGMNPLKPLLDSALHMSDGGWRKLTIRYAIFFLVLGVANEAFRRYAPDAAWASFKMGKMAASVLFSLSQAPLLMREIKAAEEADEQGVKAVDSPSTEGL